MSKVEFVSHNAEAAQKDFENHGRLLADAVKSHVKAKIAAIGVKNSTAPVHVSVHQKPQKDGSFSVHASVKTVERVGGAPAEAKVSE